MARGVGGDYFKYFHQRGNEWLIKNTAHVFLDLILLQSGIVTPKLTTISHLVHTISISKNFLLLSVIKIETKNSKFLLKQYYLKKKWYGAYVLPKRLHLNSNNVAMYTQLSVPHPSVQCCATIRAYCEKQQTPQLSFEQRGEGCSLFCAPKYHI